MAHVLTGARERACDRCPWRVANQQGPTPWGRFDHDVLGRLWELIRRGTPSACDALDPCAVPDVADLRQVRQERPRDCIGAVTLVVRELRALQAIAGGGEIGVEHIDQYLRERPNGLTRSGLRYWALQRHLLGAASTPLPEVNDRDQAIGRPASLELVPAGLS